MSLDDAWDYTTPGSKVRLNLMTMISGDGDTLQLLNKDKISLVRCTATSTDGELLVNHVYTVNSTRDSFVDLNGAFAHTHGTDDGAADGGDLAYIYSRNPEVLVYDLTGVRSLTSGAWVETTGTGGTIEYSAATSSAAPYIRLRTNTSSGGNATIQYSVYPRLDFVEPSSLIGAGKYETATNLAWHFGVSADDVTAADSNTRKYQLEVCTTTNNNYWIRTADGTNNSASDIGDTISTNDTGYRLVHDPKAGTPYVLAETDPDTGFIKSTNIPTTSLSTTANLIKVSHKNSTTSDRPFRFYGCKLSFITGSSWGYG